MRWNNFLLIFITSSLLANAHGNTPTLESMLRHGSNTSLEGKLLNAKFIVRKTEAAQAELGQNSSQVFVPFSYQIAAYKDENIHRFLYLRYTGEVVDSEYLTQVMAGPVNKFVSEFQSSLTANIFTSYIVSLLGNEGDVFINFLKGQGVDVLLNKEQLNQAKISLLQDYKSYLEKKKEDEQLDIPNPLEPEDPEQRQKVSELMKAPFFEKTENFKLVKIGNGFSWIFERDNVYIEFNFEHQLTKFAIKTVDGVYSLILENYEEYPGGAIFPKNTIIKYPDGTKYEIEASKITVYKSNIDAFNRKVDYFKKKLNNDKITPSPVLFLSI